MNKQGTILIVDDNKGVLTAVQLLLKNYFTKVITLASPVTLPAVLREEAPEVVLLDMNFTSGINNGNEGLFWLHEIKKLRPALPVVLFTAYADIDLAVTKNLSKHCRLPLPIPKVERRRVQMKKKHPVLPCIGGQVMPCSNFANLSRK